MEYLDHLALVGYTTLCLYSLYNFAWTHTYIVAFIGNVLIVVGLLALMKYHYTKIRTGKDLPDPEQKKTRLIAHSSISAFFLLTLAPASHAVFRLYDFFGLAGHIYLNYSTYANATEYIGYILLTLYFAFALVQSTKNYRLDTLGRFLLLLFFSLKVVGV